MPEAALQPFVTSQRQTGVAGKAATSALEHIWTWQAGPNAEIEAGPTATSATMPGRRPFNQQNKLGSYHCWNRIYDVHTGRWTTLDPAMSPWSNLLSYTMHNPAGLADPTGLRNRSGADPHAVGRAYTCEECKLMRKYLKQCKADIMNGSISNGDTGFELEMAELLTIYNNRGCKNMEGDKACDLEIDPDIPAPNYENSHVGCVKNAEGKWVGSGAGTRVRDIVAKRTATGDGGWGHWWLELTDLDESYGLWPANAFGTGGSPQGGVNNGHSPPNKDWKHGQKATYEFKVYQRRTGTMKWGPGKGKLCAELTRAEIIAGIREFAKQEWKFTPTSPVKGRYNCRQWQNKLLKECCLEVLDDPNDWWYDQPLD